MLSPRRNLGIKTRQSKRVRAFNHAPRRRICAVTHAAHPLRGKPRRIRDNALTMNCRSPVNPELHFRHIIIKMHPDPRIAR